MPEEEGKIFGEAYRLYEKWRGVLIDTSDKWMQVTNDFYQFVAGNNSNPLAVHLAVGIMDTFDEMYHDGKQPVIEGYLGRSDL